MDRKKLTERYGDPKERQFAARVLDLAEAASDGRGIKFTAFLDLNERRIALEMGAAVRANGPVFWGGYADAERVLAAFLPEYADEAAIDWPVAVFHAALNGGNASHRDILGALTGTGIERNVAGDIVKTRNGYFLFVLSSMEQYIRLNLGRAGRAALTLSPVEPREFDPEDIVREFRELKATVSSLRADAVVSALCGIGRSESAQLIEAGRVFVNARVLTKISAPVEENALLSIRGQGRFRLTKIGPETKKGRIALAALKYI